MRAGEVDGVDYYFMSPAEFQDAVREGEFLEHVEYAGNRYGTLRREVDRHIAEGRSVVVEIELKGARAIRQMRPDAVTIFISPPSMAELANRLERRQTDSAVEIAARLEVGKLELAAMDEFDHRVVNADLEEATQQLVRIVAEELGVAPAEQA
jgi:guanylate kinase